MTRPGTVPDDASVRVGDIAVLPVLDGWGHEVARDVLTRPGAADAWACHADQLDEHGVLTMPVGAFLVLSGDRRILVDAGVGGIDNGSYSGGQLLNSLLSHGVTPLDVTDVVFTHLHFDHVGWATRRGEVVFPTATHRVHAADWAHFVDHPDAAPGAVRKLSPLVSRLETFTADGPLLPGLDARHSPGHTPGSTVFVVSSHRARALLLGDVVHSVVELCERDWEAVFDLDPVTAAATRNAIADEVAGQPDLVGGPHFPALRFGRVVTSTGRRSFTFV